MRTPRKKPIRTRVKPRPRRPNPSRRRFDYSRRAQSQLKRFRGGSVLAVAMTAFILMFWESVTVKAEAQSAEDSVVQATNTIRELLDAFYSFLPKVLIAVAILLLGWLLSRLLKGAFSRLSPRSQKGRSVLALSQLALFVLVFVAAVSVIVGDIRALLGSLGLLGLALSWALQSPIESFSGWILNMSRGYYQIGDRIEVGNVLGDVYRIDVLTTTVWEIGGPGKPVQGAQPTGALITFPNSEILRSSVVNYTRDFNYVWDEITFGVTNESDVVYTLKIFRAVAEGVLKDEMQQAAHQYQKLLARAGISWDVEEDPQLYLTLSESYINCTIRYLVPIRSRRRLSSLLVQSLLVESIKPEHAGRIISAAPRNEVIIKSENSE